MKLCCKQQSITLHTFAKAAHTHCMHTEFVHTAGTLKENYGRYHIFTRRSLVCAYAHHLCRCCIFRGVCMSVRAVAGMCDVNLTLLSISVSTDLASHLSSSRWMWLIMYTGTCTDRLAWKHIKRCLFCLPVQGWALSGFNLYQYPHFLLIPILFNILLLLSIIW